LFIASAIPASGSEIQRSISLSYLRMMSSVPSFDPPSTTTYSDYRQFVHLFAQDSLRAFRHRRYPRCAEHRRMVAEVGIES
jgi:hypothetical protein